MYFPLCKRLRWRTTPCGLCYVILYLLYSLYYTLLSSYFLYIVYLQYILAYIFQVKNIIGVPALLSEKCLCYNISVILSLLYKDHTILYTITVLQNICIYIFQLSPSLIITSSFCCPCWSFRPRKVCSIFCSLLISWLPLALGGQLIWEPCQPCAAPQSRPTPASTSASASASVATHFVLFVVCFTTFLTCLQGLGKQLKHNNVNDDDDDDVDGAGWIAAKCKLIKKQEAKLNLNLNLGIGHVAYPRLRLEGNLQRLALPTLNASNYIFY